MYDGRIQGVFKELVENKKLVQDWKLSDWENFSKVVIEFDDYDSDECQMTITQTNIPKGIKKEYLEKGWKGMIIDPLRMICGYSTIEE